MSKVEQEFHAWIQTPDGQKVESEAVKRARAVKEKGLSRFAIGAIFESIRYDWTVGLLGDGEYRLNDHHRSFLSRRIMDNYEDLNGFFETRKLRGLQ